MTGFGRAEGAADQWRARVECKSVNKKRLDVRIHLPNEFGALEPTVRDLVRDRVERGRIEVRIDIEAIPVEAEDDREETGGQRLDSDKFHALSRELRELAQRSATGPVSLEDILTFHEYFERERPVDIDEDDEVFARIVVEAADEMVESRTEEGEGLADDLLDHLEQLDEALASDGDRARGSRSASTSPSRTSTARRPTISGSPRRSSTTPIAPTSPRSCSAAYRTSTTYEN
jgi:uncharacterized protein (TIGR00255 family)